MAMRTALLLETSLQRATAQCVNSKLDVIKSHHIHIRPDQIRNKLELKTQDIPSQSTYSERRAQIKHRKDRENKIRRHCNKHITTINNNFKVRVLYLNSSPPASVQYPNRGHVCICVCRWEGGREGGSEGVREG